MINNVTVVDAVSPVRVERSVVIRDDKIFAINPALTAAAAASPNVIDADGQFLVPGLWDMHVHFLYEPKLTEQMADLFLQYGVTSVRDTGAISPTWQRCASSFMNAHGRHLESIFSDHC